MPRGCIIQVPSLEKGDRLVISERTPFVPDVLPVTYPDEDGDPITTRYLCMDSLPEELRLRCEQHLLNTTD